MPLKLEICKISYCIPLTIAQFRILDTLEEWHGLKKSGDYWPDTWKFCQKDDINNIDFNGHFGLYIYFDAVNGAENQFLKFIEKLLTPSKEFLIGLWDGEGGCDTPDKEPKTLGEMMYNAGLEAGRRFGRDNALTFYEKDLKAFKER